MVESDTIKLLRECNAGVKMGVSSIDDVLGKVKDEKMKRILLDSKQEHEKLGGETGSLLLDYSDEGKEPNPMAKGMSWIKTNMMMAMTGDTDKQAARLITDGCNMGIESLSGYLNKYKAAEERAKNIAKSLIRLEENLAYALRGYL